MVQRGGVWCQWVDLPGHTVRRGLLEFTKPRRRRTVRAVRCLLATLSVASRWSCSPGRPAPRVASDPAAGTLVDAAEQIVLRFNEGVESTADGAPARPAGAKSQASPRAGTSPRGQAAEARQADYAVDWSVRRRTPIRGAFLFQAHTGAPVDSVTGGTAGGGVPGRWSTLATTVWCGVRLVVPRASSRASSVVLGSVLGLSAQSSRWASPSRIVRRRGGHHGGRMCLVATVVAVLGQSSRGSACGSGRAGARCGGDRRGGGRAAVASADGGLGLTIARGRRNGRRRSSGWTARAAAPNRTGCSAPCGSCRRGAWVRSWSWRRRARCWWSTAWDWTIWSHRRTGGWRWSRSRCSSGPWCWRRAIAGGSLPP
jgi:hypothetical protein